MCIFSTNNGFLVNNDQHDGEKCTPLLMQASGAWLTEKKLGRSGVTITGAKVGNFPLGAQQARGAKHPRQNILRLTVTKVSMIKFAE